MYHMMSLIKAFNDNINFVPCRYYLNMYTYIFYLFFIAVKVLTDYGRYRASGDIGKVTNAIKDALFSPQPKQRYLVGLEAKLIASIAYLPSFITDYILQFSGQLPVPNNSKT